MNSKLQKLLIVILIIIALFLIRSGSANPDTELTFNLKRAQEKAFLSLKNSPADKVDYMSGLLDERLKEFENIINNKSQSYIWTTSLRYSTTAGQITDLILANKLTNKVPEIKKQFEDHKAKLQEMYVIYPKNTGDIEYKYIEDAINYLNAYLDKLKVLSEQSESKD